MTLLRPNDERTWKACLCELRSPWRGHTPSHSVAWNLKATCCAAWQSYRHGGAAWSTKTATWRLPGKGQSHGDAIDQEISSTNRRLAAEITERVRVEVRLEQLLDALRKQKADPEILVATLSDHFDGIDAD